MPSYRKFLAAFAITLLVAGCLGPLQVYAQQRGEARFLWSVYKHNSGGMPAGARFFRGSLVSAAICEEIAEMYNTKPSVIAADVLRFQCEVSAE